ncbi:MAG: hypothetical protein WD049_05170 [Candidatus Paceibacterota bacterium]
MITKATLEIGVRRMNDHVDNTGPPHHPAVIVEVGDCRVEIDKALAPLIQQMWLAEIDTCQSCQEAKPGMAWIAFPDVEELMRFLQLVTRYESGIDTLYNRILKEFAGPTSAPAWEVELELWDEGFVYGEGVVSLAENLGVYFPVTDIPVLIQRLEEFNLAPSQ